MTDYVLTLSYFGGIVAGATHYRGRVQGPYAGSCHGGKHFGPDTGGQWQCAEGHELPERVQWDVEAAWSEERYERYAARGFEGDGPTQFAGGPKDVIEAAVARFLGQTPARRWFEDSFVPGQPGDRLFLDFVPQDESELDKEGADLIGAPPYGSLLAEVPAAEEKAS